MVTPALDGGLREDEDDPEGDHGDCINAHRYGRLWRVISRTRRKLN